MIRHLTTLALVTLLTLPAANAIAGSNNHASLSALLARLVSDDRDSRSQAALELKTHQEGIYPALQTIYVEGDALSRKAAITAMALLPYPAIGSPLFRSGLRDPDPGVRGMAAHGLALIGHQGASLLVEELSAEDRAAQNAAAFGLSLLGRQAIPALIKGLQSPDIYVRSKAAWILGRMEDKAIRAVPALIQALDVKDERAMHVIAEAIDQIGPDPAIALHHLKLIHAPGDAPLSRVGAQAAPVLVRLLRRPGTPIGQLAFRALAETGPPAKPALRHGLRGDHLGQQVACGLLLLEIDPGMAPTLPEEVRAVLVNSGR